MLRLIPIVIGAALALAGVTQGMDGIVDWVFGIVDGIAYVDIWRPLYNPEPMDTYAYRPLSVLLLKLGLWVTGHDAFILTLIHSAVLVFFGFSARGFLLRHNFSNGVATAAATSALMMPSLLFSAWICVEFDLVGATFVLAASNALNDAMASRPAPASAPSLWARFWRPGLRFWLYAVVAVTIKETSALQLLAYLAAASLVRWSDVRWWRVTGAYLLLLIFCTLPMHFVESDNLHAFTVWSDGFHPMRIFGIILHTGAQLVFLLSAAGVALLACGAARFVSFRWRSALAWLLLLLVIVGAPVLRYYSHFEAIIFSDGPWTIFQVCLLAGGLLVALSGSSSLTKAEKTALLTVGLTWLGYAAAPVVLRFARADVSARIFAACVPILHALVFRELFALWRGRSRALSAAFGVLFALFVLSSAFNTVSFHRVRLSVELEAKKGLSSDFRMAEPALINTNAVQLMSVEQLRALGASRLGPEAWIQTTSSQPDAGMTVDQFAEAGGILADRGQDVYLYIQTARSSMSPYANQIFAGDFSWADDWLPESDDDLFAGYQRMIYETETDIELLFIREGHRLVRVRADYWQLPLSWNEVPRRMWLGLPLIEDYRYVARVYRIPARQPGWHPPGGRSRHRRGAAP